ncbi:MAG: hypothetical protein WC292_04685 [Clostridia bacterium]
MQKSLEIFDKLKKVPAFVWVILIGLSYVFANYYALRWSYNELLVGMRDGFAASGVDAETLYEVLGQDFFAMLASPGVIVFYLVMSGLIGVIIFEIILHLVYRSLFLRRYTHSDPKSFKQTARVVYIAANAIIGLYSLLFFLVPEVYAFGVEFINFAVYTAALTFGYLIVSHTVIYPQFVAVAFKRLYTLYFVINGIFAVLSFITVVTGDNMLHIISGAIDVAVIAALAIVINATVYKKLLEREKNYIIPTPPPEDDEIYKGFGF